MNLPLDFDELDPFERALPVQVVTEDEARGRGQMTLLQPNNTHVDAYGQEKQSYSERERDVLFVLEKKYHDILGYPDQHKHENADEMRRCCSLEGHGLYLVLLTAHRKTSKDSIAWRMTG